MSDFDQYERIKKEVTNDIMARLHPILNEIREAQTQNSKDVKALSVKIEPVLDIIQNATGFNRIGLGLLKLLIMIGAAIGGLYVVFEFLRKISK